MKQKKRILRSQGCGPSLPALIPLTAVYPAATGANCRARAAFGKIPAARHVIEGSAALLRGWRQGCSRRTLSDSRGPPLEPSPPTSTFSLGQTSPSHIALVLEACLVVPLSQHRSSSSGSHLLQPQALTFPSVREHTQILEPRPPSIWAPPPALTPTLSQGLKLSPN